MPKASASTSRASGDQPFQSAHVLRRNQACHQCRKRKLKCDAKRPCSTCVRSHSYAVAHAPAGAELPPHPHCTFDEVSEADTNDLFEHPKTRFERLENRINELETLLREKDKTSSSQQSGFVRPPIEVSLSSRPNENFIANISDVSPASHIVSIDVDPFQVEQLVGVDNAFALPQFQSGSALDNLAGVASLIGTPSAPSPASRINTASASPTIDASTNPTTPSSDQGQDLFHSAWPRNLPTPTFLRHLVDAFFSYHPDATRLFHQSTFLASLTLPPTHPRFPAASVLHAICAVGSMYTAALPRPHIPTSPDFSPYDIFPDKYKLSEGVPDTFSEMQAKYAKEALEAAMDVGKELFQNVQALILLSWWYWCNAKWAEAFLNTSHALRYSLPCGLNVCPPFHAIAETLRPPSLLGPAKTVIEDEMRRNTFWIGYAIERTHGTGNGWAMTLDDQDVSQLLPVRRDQFEQGILVLPAERQWSHENDMLLTHPEDQIDPFILYIKSTILLSKVKNFNLRFRQRYHTHDPSAMPTKSAKASLTGESVDPRETEAFVQLDRLITLFKASFPAHLRNPIKDTVDPHLFAACTAAQYAEILLHEPHAVVGRSTCTSSCKILHASRAILDLLYNVYSTSYDVSLLGLFPMMCWFMAGRVLVRFLRVAIDCGSEETCATLRAEVDFISMIIFRVGAHVPLAHRYGKMLHDFIVQLCGEQYVESQPLVMPQREYVENIPAYSAQPAMAVPA
ncbi:uncharacterized protein LAESUDRAFT_726455 [Laetiporus sulphureus 93-53]|uniref:Zn(2)-C6 fungal-type domain-containing protein n=1 Tax=Laetiporus sulphureus 93-53 TaxID=1314785 RepID=A0A165DYH9_9APHY|nr:uncharacterized protein LAESUDRAFT_726455 [Laetiporus sulphureus 93-53]KZT05881.1 hypothetical protein LAESUDRAFT_726455 [Laetiporus sulphureus 93-53]